MIANADLMQSLNSQLGQVRWKIIRLRRQCLRDFGSKKKEAWPEGEQLRLRKLKDAAKTLQERIAALIGHYAEAAE